MKRAVHLKPSFKGTLNKRDGEASTSGKYPGWVLSTRWWVGASPSLVVIWWTLRFQDGC